MAKKKIFLFEKHDGVRFVLERSLAKYHEKIQIHSFSWKEEIKKMINLNHLDLLITELDLTNPIGIGISSFARSKSPNLKILWVTALGCDVFREHKQKLGDIICIEKPLQILDFRTSVLDLLEISTI